MIKCDWKTLKIIFPKHKDYMIKLRTPKVRRIY